MITADLQRRDVWCSGVSAGRIDGYGTEAVREVLRYGLEILQLRLIVAIAYPENVASIRIMQKIGMEPDGFGEWEGKTIVRYVATLPSGS